jgi:proteasome lid subunit RPN8/RPN11
MLDIASKLLPMLTKEGTPERCGLVLRTGRIVELNNVAEDPVTGFRMDPTKVVTFLSKKRASPIATWHTHPGGDPNFSERDYSGFLQWPDLDHYIVGVRNGKPTVVKFEVENGVVLVAGEVQ